MQNEIHLRTTQTKKIRISKGNALLKSIKNRTEVLCKRIKRNKFAVEFFVCFKTVARSAREHSKKGAKICSFFGIESKGRS
jgi:hypothetical protein